jgi:hypothetical protein
MQIISPLGLRLEAEGRLSSVECGFRARAGKTDYEKQNLQLSFGEV